MSVEDKASAFDRLYASLKQDRASTNVPERRAIYDEMLDKFRWQIILMEEFHLCRNCGKRLPPVVINWAYGRDVKWFCVDCFNDMKERGIVHVDFEAHGLSFKCMMKKAEAYSGR